ncbi:MAG: TonB family protein [Gammaproteobacteria bacterium]
MTKSRLAIIGTSALTINLVLFVLMEAMSVQAPLNLKAIASVLSVDFVRLKKQPEPPKIQEREKPPEHKPEQHNLLTPDVSVPRPRPLRVNDIDIDIPRIDLSMSIAGVPFSGVMADTGMGGLTEAIPLVRTAPLYPPSALSRRIQGHVKVLFTVNEEGNVEEPKVIEAKPSTVFDNAALRAIRKWKFRKKIVDGQPVSWQSVQTIIFKLER